MNSVDETLHLILSHAPRLDAELVAFHQALHRVLAADALADSDSPPFDCSAVDGYALCSADSPGVLNVVSEIQPGDSTDTVLQPGKCARIFTGAKIPAGADCVLMQERAQFEGGRLRVPAVPSFDCVRRQGENCRRGSVIVSKGQRLRAVELATLAQSGVTQPLVGRQPRVVHFVTGNELVGPSETPAGSQIRDCNSILIASLLADHGAILTHQSRLLDRFETSARILEEHTDFDVLLISGGSSVGDYDFAMPLLQHAGFSILANGVNLRPGKPLIFAKRNRQLAFGIPGNPLSHVVIFHLFIAPLLTSMMGAGAPASHLFEGRVARSIKGGPRETWWPCRAKWEGNGFRLEPLRFQSSGDIGAAVGADALLHLPANREVIESDLAEFLWLQSPH